LKEAGTQEHSRDPEMTDSQRVSKQRQCFYGSKQCGEAYITGTTTSATVIDTEMNHL